MQQQNEDGPYYKGSLEEFLGKPKVKHTKKSDEKKNVPRAVFRGNDNYLLKSNHGEEDAIPLRLKALCANWLKMQNVICLIGSGASAQIGCLLGEIKTRVKSYLKQKSQTDLINTFDKFFPDSETNFELCLSRLVSLSKMIETHPDLVNNQYSKENIDELIKTVQGVVFYCCNLKLPTLDFSQSEPQYDVHRHFIRKLVGRADSKLSRVKLVTTNYDTLLEQAMDSLGVLHMDSFIGTVNRKFDTSCFGLDYYYPGEQSAGAVTRYDKFLHLYKVHGSINWWGSSGDKDKELTWRNIDESTVQYFKKVDPTKLTEEEIQAIQNAINLMKDQWLGIQPTSVKYSETMNMPYSHLFRYFANALREPQTVCFVIGYGFGDEHINKLIYDALANPSFSLVIVSPSSSNGEIERILKNEQLDRVYWFAGEYGYFANFVKDVMPDLAEVETELRVQKMVKMLKDTPNKASGESAGGD